MTMLWKHTNDGFVAEPLRIVRDADAPGVDIHQGGNGHRCRIVPFGNGAGVRYVLIANADIHARVNGLALVGGIGVLEHKDEIVVNSQRMFFSAESTPVVEAFKHAGSQRLPRCPLCRGQLEDGQSAVRCPGCSRIYHQIAAADDAPEKFCWTYAPACRFCEHPTTLSGEPTWRPDTSQE